MTGNRPEGADTSLRILSAGAPKTGIRRCLEAFESMNGVSATIAFATAPVLRDMVEQGDADVDLIVAPVQATAVFLADGLTVAGCGGVVGSVHAGVVVREGVPHPDITSVEALKTEILAADSVVYNVASSGLYIAEMMAKLGLAERVADKTVRLPTGAAVMTHLAESVVTKEIGFGQIPEIRNFQGKGIDLVGPLPDGVEKITTYAVSLLDAAENVEVAKAFIEYLLSRDGESLLRESGIE